MKTLMLVFVMAGGSIGAFFYGHRLNNHMTLAVKTIPTKEGYNTIYYGKKSKKGYNPQASPVPHGVVPDPVPKGKL